MGLRLVCACLLGLTIGLPAMPARADQSAHQHGPLVIALATELPQAMEAPDLWARIRAGLVLDDPNPDLTRQHEQWFADHADSLERAVQRSRPYLFHIVEEVQKRGMPMEIALLPIIESSFNPMALSHQKASGIWQFMPSTGKVFGLQQDAWFDGRRDVVASTRAALDYLEKLFQIFGDWPLALAAYNCGEGCVQRAQDKSNNSDYASLSLPRETRNYVPRLLAVSHIIRDPASFGLELESLANESYFMQVQLSKPMAAKKAAELAEVSLDEFLALNPAFNRSVIYTKTHNVMLLPSDHVETFHFNLHRQGLDRAFLQTYTAQRGESASQIAARFGVSLDWLKEHNPLKLWRGKVAQAQPLLVPQTATAKPVAAVKAFASKPPAEKSSTRQHTVRKGDTLYRLAKLYKVSVDDIRRLNEGSRRLHPGDTLTIPLADG
jgi:membrane-bound lytic murein transglycosylase D